MGTFAAISHEQLGVAMISIRQLNSYTDRRSKLTTARPQQDYSKTTAS